MRIIRYNQALEIAAFKSESNPTMQHRNKVSGIVGSILDKKMPLLGADKEAVVFNIMSTLCSSRVSVASGNATWYINPEDVGVYPCLNGFCKFPSEKSELPARARHYEFARQVENFVACTGKCVSELIKVLQPESGGKKEPSPA